MTFAAAIMVGELWFQHSEGLGGLQADRDRASSLAVFLMLMGSSFGRNVKKEEILV
jgi:hypothetical protein